jgi:predicted nuclease of predicted toxin-antitoxin system
VNLGGLTFLADENIHPGVVAWMRARTLDVVTTNDLAVNGRPDDVVLEAAAKSRRVLLTQDADFGRRAVAGPKRPPGVIVIRRGHAAPGFTTGSLDSLFAQNPEITPPFLIVISRSDTSINIRVRSIDDSGEDQ